MFIESLIQKCSNFGIILFIDSSKGGLNYRVPKEYLTEHQKQELKQLLEPHKHAIISYLEQQQLEWKEAIETLLTKPKPECFNQAIWADIKLQVKELAKSPHLTNIIYHGWSRKEIFGCHPTHPNRRYAYAGLVMILGDKTIQAVTTDTITLKSPAGAVQTHRRSAAPLFDQITLMELEEGETNDAPQSVESVSEVRNPDSSSLLRPFNEIKQAGLEEYYDYFQERAAIREFDGQLPKEDAEWQAMNDTVYKFMEDHHVDQGSIEVNRFIKKMVRLE